MATFRDSGLQISSFRFQSGSTPEYCGDLIDVSLSMEVASEEASGICDQWNFAWATGQSWSVEGEAFTGGSSALTSNAWIMLLVGTVVALNWQSGANLYSGTALITAGSHSASKRNLQKQKFTLTGQGPLIVTAAS